MKDKPPFILFTNLNKSLNSKIANPIKYKKDMGQIYSRIPEDVLENSEELKKIVFKERKPVYDVINLYNKPKEIEITHDMSDQTQKNLENINSFREDLYEFNQEESKLLGNFSLIKKENEIFGNQYHNMQRLKYRFKSGTYLDHDYLIPIASKYFAKGIKVPKIYTGKSVFSGNPLILSGSELEDFIVYNLGDRKKGTQFLERLEDLLEKKEHGIYIPPEKKEKPEYLKGYVPPELLIPQLQNEVQMSKDTIKDLNSLENFFKDKKSLSDKSEKEKSKISIKKNLPMIKRFNNRNKLNLSNNNSINLSNIEPLSPLSQKDSPINNKFNSNENSSLSTDKSTLFIFSKLPQSGRKKDRISVINDLYSEQSKRKSNLPNINYLLRNLKGRFSNINIKNNIRPSLQNNSAEASNKIHSRNTLLLNKYTRDKKIEEKTNSDESEKNDLELIKELNTKQKNKLKRSSQLKLNLSDNNDSLKEKERAKKKLKKLKFKKQKDDKSLIKTEKMFNLALNEKDFDNNKIEIIKFLKKRGYNTSRRVNNQELFKNMDRVEKGMQKSILQDEIRIRGELINTKYKNLLEKNNTLSKQIEENTFKYKKMIMQKNMGEIDV